MDGIILKLENLVTKLEKSKNSNLAKEIHGQLSDVKSGKIDGLSSIVKNLESQLGGENEGGDSSESLSVYESITGGPLASFISTSNSIGGDLAQHAAMITAAFQAQRQFLQTASESKQPSSADIQKLLKPTADLINQIQQFRETNRRSDVFNHLSAISESIPALGWVSVAPTPAPYVKEMKDAGMFYTNRVLKDWKEKDGRHVEWVKNWVETLNQLQDFVKQYHTTGLVWNPKGSEASLDVTTPKVEIIKATPTTTSKPAPVKTPKVYGQTTDKSPSMRQDGKKWMVEYFKGDQTLTIDNVEMNQTVYIWKCENSVVKINGKCNNVIVDSCKKIGVVFDSTVSGCNVINSSGVRIQVLGAVPMIQVDKTDGCQMFLSKDSINAEIVTAKSSEMNVLVPKDDDDFVEMPIPEQFKSVINGLAIITNPTESV